MLLKPERFFSVNILICINHVQALDNMDVLVFRARDSSGNPFFEEGEKRLQRIARPLRVAPKF